MLSLNQCSILLGYTGVGIVLVLTWNIRKEVVRSDLGNLCGAFAAAYNIPYAIFLCWYAFHPDPPEILAKTQLLGCEKYLGIAGMASLYMSYLSFRGYLPEKAKAVPDRQQKEEMAGQQEGLR